MVLCGRINTCTALGLGLENNVAPGSPPQSCAALFSPPSHNIPHTALPTAQHTQGKRPVRTGIGRTQPAVDGRRDCTVCVPLSPFEYYFSPYWDRFDNGISVVEAVPIRTETVCRLSPVLCPCVRAIFPVTPYILTITCTANHRITHITTFMPPSCLIV